MLLSKNYSKLRISFSCYQSRLLHTKVNETELNIAKEYANVPGPTVFKLLKDVVLPGGKYYKLPMNDLTIKLREEYGPIYKLPPVFGKRGIVIISSPEAAEIIGRTEGKRPIRRGIKSLHYFRKNYRQDVFENSPGLLTTQGDEWYNFRSKVNGVLMQPKVTKLYIPKMDGVAQDFVRKIRQLRDNNCEMPDNFLDNLNDYILEANALIAFDTRLGVIESGDNSKFHQLLKEMLVHIYELDFKPSLWRYFKTPGFRKAMKNYEEINDVVDFYITAAKEKQNESNLSGADNESVLSKLLKIDKNVANVMVQDMFIVGIDTTTSAAAACLYCIAKNPEKQEILRQEIFKLLPEKDSQLTTTSLNNIPYLRACIKESMRVYPAVTGFGRGLSQDLILHGYKIPKDTDVMILANIASEESNFKRGKEFIPERWLKDNNDPACPHATDSHPYAFLPFGHGTRMCIGRRIAEVEIEVLIARVLREFKLEWRYPEIKFYSTIVNTPACALKYKFTDL